MPSTKTTSAKTSAIATIMTRHVSSIRADDTIHEALEEMVDQQFSALPVVNHAGHCIGMLTRTDLADFFLKMDRHVAQSEPSRGRDWEDGHTVRVRELMAHELIAVRGEDSVLHAARLLATHKIHHLPVIDQGGVLVGIVSTLDIAQWVADNGPDA